jgi:hypothetical protein
MNQLTVIAKEHNSENSLDKANLTHHIVSNAVLRDGLIRDTISMGHFVQGVPYPRKFYQGHIGQG